ncbi:hypothetical protein D6779_00780 [Candidatus Parcubacteria bacterium]|nr:MAG: hypothetical protein D6779_00780 [Candidatus Parcubacteria bacterium]
MTIPVSHLQKLYEISSKIGHTIQQKLLPDCADERKKYLEAAQTAWSIIHRSVREYSNGADFVAGEVKVSFDLAPAGNPNDHAEVANSLSERWALLTLIALSSNKATSDDIADAFLHNLENAVLVKDISLESNLSKICMRHLVSS